MAKIGITETALRDAHQSLIATRMRTEEMLPILEMLDRVGYQSLECWGGATFDACLRFLDEDPWERLRAIRKRVRKTKLQMLLRGQNLLGYRHYADDVVEYFVKKAVENGIDIIRIFDALNDLRNMETAVRACKSAGGHVQAALCYTISPVHSLEYFVEVGKRLVDMGADSICIKDMAGLLLPYEAYDLVKALKENISVPLQVHTHYTSGAASMTYLKAIEAGADVVDCAISPLALGTSQPPTESLVASLKGTPYDTGLDLELLGRIAGYFRKDLREEYVRKGLLDTRVMGVDVNALVYQIPGGMLSNLVSQLKQSNAMDKYEEVLKEVPRVREDFGFPPLVTPTSQIVGTQAVLNVVTGERYKMVPRESKALVKGEYGKTPAPVSETVMKKILGDEEAITCRPADLIEPELDILKEKIGSYMEKDEDLLTYALFPQIAESFFKKREEKKKGEPDGKKAKKVEEKGGPDEELVAVITAAVMASAKTKPGSGLVVRSIRRADQAFSLWNFAGRILNMR